MEALRGGGLQAQKENVDVVFVGGSKSGLGLKGGARNGLLTPSAKRSALTTHSEGKPARKGLKDSAKKNRRVLGDISNRHVNRREESNPGEGAAAKKQGVAVVKTPIGKAKTPVATPKARDATPLKTTPVVKSLDATKPSSNGHIEEVELPYGGLPSREVDAKSLREEMLRELQDSKTPTFFDDFDASDTFDVWDCKKERTMLETGVAPSDWWAPPPLTVEVPSLDHLDDVPPPLEFADDLLDPVVGLESLDEVLSVDLDAATSE